MKLTFTLSLEQFGIAQVALVSGVIALGLFAYLFTSLTGYSNLFGFLRLLDVGSEQSIPTFVSVLNLLLASLLNLVIYLYERAKNSNGAGYWLLLSVLFLFLSLDESAGIHENFRHFHTFLVERNLIAPVLSSHTWLPFGVLFVVVVAAVMVPFLRNLPPDTLRCFLLAGGIFVTGAIGFEFLGAVMLETGMVDSKKHIAYLIRRIFEEAFEMYGIAFFNWTLYREILRRKIVVVLNG